MRGLMWLVVTMVCAGVSAQQRGSGRTQVYGLEGQGTRFVYVFDPNVQWTFLVEMVKLTEENKKTSYPAVVKSFGTAPKQYKQVTAVREEASPDLALDPLLDDELDEDEDETPENDIADVEEGVEDNDILGLEGEEGEEEEMEDADEEGGDMSFDENQDED